MIRQDTRIGDTERDHALVRLREACVNGELTLEEYAERVETTLGARTHGQLAPVLEDLGTAPTPRLPARMPEPEGIRWSVAVMGECKQEGRWQPRARNVALALMGECRIDLRDAELHGPEVVVEAYAAMGTIHVVAPEGVEVEVEGFALMGVTRRKLRPALPAPGAPRIRVRAFALMGEITIESRP